MKRFYLAIMLSAGALAMNAQTTVQGSKFTDNWSVGINAGGVTTIHTGYAFWKHMRPVFGIQIGKQFTPALGMTLEGNASVNTSPSKTAFDASNISLLGRVNLMNLFAGPRVSYICNETSSITNHTNTSSRNLLYDEKPNSFSLYAVGGLSTTIGHLYIDFRYAYCIKNFKDQSFKIDLDNAQTGQVKLSRTINELSISIGYLW